MPSFLLFDGLHVYSVVMLLLHFHVTFDKQHAILSLHPLLIQKNHSICGCDCIKMGRNKSP